MRRLGAGMGTPALLGLLGLLGLLVATAGCDHAASVFTGAAAPGAGEAQLGWFLIAVSCLVVLVVLVLLPIAALWRRRERTQGAPGTIIDSAVPSDAREQRWLVLWALLVPTGILTAAFVFTVVTINAAAVPPSHPSAGRATVTGHQWWWEIAYDDSSGQGFTTANEMHLPVGQPIRITLQTADVIHSFWVPQLAGKTDIIPGQDNTMWIEARQPGVFSGPCGEYCGAQHAQMRLTVVAESPDAYRAWVATQRQVGRAPGDSTLATGRRTFMTAGCASCHTIRGTEAAGTVGPDLTHFGSRRTLAATGIENTQANVMGWIVDPQGMKPGNDMPRMAVAPRALQPLAAYLETLK